ncbi:MAG TPA: hypothetical protein VGJ15_13445 [Pirellulales bacterium]
MISEDIDAEGKQHWDANTFGAHSLFTTGNRREKAARPLLQSVAIGGLLVKRNPADAVRHANRWLTCRAAVFRIEPCGVDSI